MASGYFVVPKLVEETSLKRARTEIDGESAINVNAVNLTPLGKTDDSAWDGSSENATVISLLKGICNKL